MSEQASSWCRPDRKRFYEQELLREVPRVLSGMDRCPVSATSGCLDREYWAWATKDFANIDLQRGLLVLAYVYQTPFPDNGYHRQQALVDWIEAGLRFWINRQDRHGGFDHLYLHESSWMAAAFTLLDLLETFDLVGERIATPLRDDWLLAMAKAGQLLVQRDERHGFISNHRAGAAAALLGLSRLTGRETFRQRAWALMEGVYARQSSEGWFLEYEGADPGYQTLDTHYQARFFRYLEDHERGRVIRAVGPSLDFLACFLHPDGSIGGEYGSRNCPHCFPGGFEVFAEHLPLAAAIARQGTRGLASGDSCGLADADTRNRVPMATSYVLAHQALSKPGEHATAALPWETDFERSFPQAGLYVRASGNHYTVFGASKGGVVKVFDRRHRRLVFSSCGYSGRLADNTPITSHMWTTRPRMSIMEQGDEHQVHSGGHRRLSVEAPFFVFRPDRTMPPLGFILLRLFNLSLGRIRPISDWFRKNIIIGRYLKARKPVPVFLRRTLVLDGEDPTIEDEIVLSKSCRLKDLREHGFFSTVYMASARYFRKQDLVHAWSTENLAPRVSGGRLKRAYAISHLAAEAKSIRPKCAPDTAGAPSQEATDGTES